MKDSDRNIFQIFYFFYACIFAFSASLPAACIAATDNNTPVFPANIPPGVSATNDSYTVQKGDCLGKILREMFKLPDAIIFSPQTNIIIQEANPQIHSLNDLHEGQRLIIPVQVLENTARKNTDSVPHQQAALTAAKHDVRLGASTGSSQFGSNDNTTAGLTGHTQSPRAPAQTIHLETDETSIRESSLPGADALQHEKKIKSMLSNFTQAFEGNDNTSCIKTLPIENGGIIVMDCSQFPMYIFPWGRGIILDYGDKMPASIRKFISTQWEQTNIIAASYHENAETILDRVIDGCGLNKIESGNRYIVSLGAIQISVSGTWIVFKDSFKKNIFVIAIEDETSHHLPDSVKSYLADVGIKLVQLGSEEKQPPAYMGSYSPAYKSTQVQVDPVRMTDLLLELLEITTQKNIKTKITPQNAHGITVEVNIDRKFTLAGKTCFIDFKNLSPSIADILTNNGYRIIQIDIKNNDYIKIVKELLVFCNVHNASFPALLQYDQTENASIKFSIPGFLIHTKSGDILLTNIDFDKNLFSILSEFDIRVIKF